jgi:predicted RNase H-like HicB family nuclease
MESMSRMRMTLTIELDREDDGRWIAEVIELPGVLVYGASRELAIQAVQSLALRVLADRLEHGEEPASLAGIEFASHAA